MIDTDELRKSGTSLSSEFPVRGEMMIAAADYLAEREEAQRWARWYKKNYDGLRAYALKCDPLKSWAEKHGIDLTR